MNQLETPVAFMVFNRPETTRRVFAAIAAARPSRLLLIADGARGNRPGYRKKAYPGGAKCVGGSGATAAAHLISCSDISAVATADLGSRRRVSRSTAARQRFLR